MMRMKLGSAMIVAAMMVLTAVGRAQDSPGDPSRGQGAASFPAGPPFAASYADIADLADAAPLIVRVRLRKIAPVASQAGGQAARQGTARFYVEAQTIALIAQKSRGDAALGGLVAFLVDLPLDAKGRVPAIKKRDAIVFARATPGRPGELALIAPDALLLWDADVDARLRAIVTALIAPDAPAKVTGVRELVNTPGDLAGASETQVFLATGDGSAASLSIAHAPGSPAGGQPPRWGVSFSELVAATGSSPSRDTLPWYRLACFLARVAPGDANHSDTDEARARAANDYRFVIAALGPCPRLRR